MIDLQVCQAGDLRFANLRASSILQEGAMCPARLAAMVDHVQVQRACNCGVGEDAGMDYLRSKLMEREGFGHCSNFRAFAEA